MILLMLVTFVVCCLLAIASLLLIPLIHPFIHGPTESSSSLIPIFSCLIPADRDLDGHIYGHDRSGGGGGKGILCTPFNSYVPLHHWQSQGTSRRVRCPFKSHFTEIGSQFAISFAINSVVSTVTFFVNTQKL